MSPPNSKNHKLVRILTFYVHEEFSAIHNDARQTNAHLTMSVDIALDNVFSMSVVSP